MKSPLLLVLASALALSPLQAQDQTNKKTGSTIVQNTEPVPADKRISARSSSTFTPNPSATKSVKLIRSLILLVCGFLIPAPGYAADELKLSVIEDGTPRDGVYMLSNRYSTTVLELKAGHFRYWFESDLRTQPEPTYPLVGEYSIKGDTITLNNKQIYERLWTFRTLNGQLTLWRPAAVDSYTQDKDLDPYGILHVTEKSAEEAWAHRRGQP